jgi:uncharacterized membrane protein
MRSHLSDPPRSGWHPVVAVLAAFPLACFTCALLTDLAYAETADMMWSDFSAWLLAVGMAGGVVAGIAALIDLMVRHRRGAMRRPVWPAALCAVVALAAAFINNLVHSRDAWTSVVPYGLALSVVTVLAMAATAWTVFGRFRSGTRTTSYAGAGE